MSYQQSNQGRNYQSGNNYNNQKTNTGLKDIGPNFDPVEEGQKLVEKIDPKRGFTTSQLRKVLSSAAVVKNKIDRECSDAISKDIQDEIQYLRLKLVYQMGRDPNVKIGLSQSGIDLPSIIKNIGASKEKFNKFYRLLESIVAYKKFNEDNRG